MRNPPSRPASRRTGLRKLHQICAGGQAFRTCTCAPDVHGAVVEPAQSQVCTQASRRLQIDLGTTAKADGPTR